MSIFSVEWENVRSSCEATSARVAELIRSAPNGDAPVPGLDWTVVDVAAHLVSLTQRYEPFVRNTPRPAFDSMPQLNAEELAPLTAVGLEELADHLERGTTSLLSLCGSGQAPARFFDMDSDCTSVIALYVEELLVHGLDLARATGEPWSITHAEALIALAGAFHVLPKLVDVESTRGRLAVFEIRLRGGPTVSVTFEDGTATVGDGRVTRADCRISADPVAFLLTGMGRQSQWRAAATGKVFAFGRKPWLALRFTKFLVAA